MERNRLAASVLGVYNQLREMKERLTVLGLDGESALIGRIVDSCGKAIDARTRVKIAIEQDRCIHNFEFVGSGFDPFTEEVCTKCKIAYIT